MFLQVELPLNPVGSDMIALPQELIQAVRCCFKKSDTSWLSWDGVSKVLLEQDGITRSHLQHVTSVIEFVFGIKKSTRKGFPLEIYFNSNQTHKDLIELYVKSCLEVDVTKGVSLHKIAEDFLTNNPNVSTSATSLLQILAESIKRYLLVKKNATFPPTWPISF